MHEDVDQLAALEEVNRQRIQGWFDLAGIEAAYPVHSDTVVKLLRTVEFAVTHDRLLYLINSEAIPPVPRIGGKLAFSATNIVTVASAADYRRWWLPLSTLHQHKFSLVEKLQHVAGKRGDCAINDLAEYDLDFLVGLLHRTAGDKATTEMLADAVKLKWAQEKDSE